MTRQNVWKQGWVFLLFSQEINKNMCHDENNTVLWKQPISQDFTTWHNLSTTFVKSAAGLLNFVSTFYSHVPNDSLPLLKKSASGLAGDFSSAVTDQQSVLMCPWARYFIIIDLSFGWDW